MNSIILSLMPFAYLPVGSTFLYLFMIGVETADLELPIQFSAQTFSFSQLFLERRCVRLQFTPGRDNVVADLPSRSIPTPPTPLVLASEQEQAELVQLLHTPLQETVSLRELQDASAADPVLSSVLTFTRQGCEGVR